MKTIFTIIFISISTSFFAQIFVSNNSDEPIWVATVTYQSNGNFRGYVSSGWYKIIPGERKGCGGGLHDGDNTFYVHAHNADWTKTWGTENYFAVDKTNAFRIENCDMQYVQKAPENKRVGFSKNFVHIGFFDLYEVDISISE
jgi:hypothetical protein